MRVHLFKELYQGKSTVLLLIFAIYSIIILFTTVAYYLCVSSEIPEPINWDQED